jgi:glycosyltransferase involved in cell wall biosynthesis
MVITQTPRVSVVMPVHNALPYLDAAVESILGQTFNDFEFVILDDASTDGSTQRLRQWASRDARIRLLEEKHNLGPALSSQRVASAAAASFVARMDADDISLPDRLSAQIAVFDRHPEAGVIASLCDFIDTKGRKLRGSEPWRLARRSPFVPFAHGAMMYRRDVFDRAGGYRRECEYWEDQDLVTRMSAVAPVMVIPRALYRVRLSATSTRAASDAARLEHAVDIMYRSTDRLGTRQRYDDLLAPAGNETDKVDPRVFISLGSQLLWAGGRPRLFKRLLRRGHLAADFHTLSALVWTAWASLGPGSLRTFLRSLLFVRNYRASLIMKDGSPVPWAGAMPSSRSAMPPVLGERPVRALDERYTVQSASAFSPQRRRAK